MQRIHWMDLPGNKYLKKLDPLMLKNRCTIEQTIKQVRTRRNEAPKTVEVFYDRDYVMTKISIDVIAPLQIDSLECLIALVTDAWNDSQTLQSYNELQAG